MSGPVTKIRNLFPEFAPPKLNRTASVLSSSVLIVVAWITLLGFPCSTAKTLAIGPVLVTPGPGGPGRNTLLRKQAPPMITSCAALQSPSLGVTPSTTGARTLVLSVADVDRAFRTLVKGGMKNRLLSPSPNLVVSVAVPTPPHA